MPELRIILLVVGVLFVAGIAGFEWWRSRGSRPLAASAARDDGPADTPARPAPAPLPEINVVRDTRVARSDSLPVIELASTSESGTRRALGISISDDVAVDVAHDSGVRASRAARAQRAVHRPGRQHFRGARARRTAGARAAARARLAERNRAAHRHAARDSDASSRVSRAARCARRSAPPVSGTARSTSITCPMRTAAWW